MELSKLAVALIEQKFWNTLDDTASKYAEFLTVSKAYDVADLLSAVQKWLQNQEMQKQGHLRKAGELEKTFVEAFNSIGIGVANAELGHFYKSINTKR